MSVRRLSRILPVFAVLAVSASFLPNVTLAQAPAKVPIEAFFHEPSFSGAQLSPDAKHVAMLLTPKGGHTMLAVMDVETRVPRVLVKVDSDVARVYWVNDQRLVFSMTDLSVAPGEVTSGNGIFAINIDGSEAREIATRRRGGSKDGVVRFEKDTMPYFTQIYPNMGRQDSDYIHVWQGVVFRDEGSSMSLFRVNTKTGKAEVVKRPPTGKTFGWLLDADGEPRVTTVRVDGKIQLQYREAEGQWRKLTEAEQFDPMMLSAAGFAPDGKLYVTSRQGKDKVALYGYDVKENKLGAAPIVDMTDYDFNGSLVNRNGKLAGVHYLVDAPGTLWLDPAVQKIQAAVDKLLPATFNRISFPRRATTSYVMVHSVSDAQPGMTWLFNTETGKLDLLGEDHPEIDARQMARVGMVKYKARDGLEIPAYLTLPKGERKNLPLVVMVHGGPWVRGGTGTFNADAQFLASRGYAVLAPEFRGSIGFGMRHFTAGFKQWGLAMQDDITDGVKWAIAQGLVDPKRVCIAGASYGGYAAMMGLVKEPAMFKCGINYVGVTDIGMLYTAAWSDATDITRQYTLPLLVGDQDKDAAQLKETSPLLRAGSITQPVLLAYGGVDRRVPLAHGTKFRDALTATKNVEWIEYADEGHGWRLLKNRIDFWSRVEKFLDRNIGPGAAGK